MSNPIQDSIDLVREIAEDGRRLVVQEIALAKAEASEKLSVVGRHAFVLCIGLALGIAALVVLLSSINRGLTVALEPALSLEIAVWLAPLILFAVFGTASYLVVRRSLYNLRNDTLTLEKTQQTLKENKRWIQHKSA